MSRITRTIAAALTSLVIFTPAATAMPSGDAVGTASLAGPISSSLPDQSSCGTGLACRPNAQNAGLTAGSPPPGLPAWPVDREPAWPARVNAVPVAGVDDTSPLVYVLPGIVVSLMLAAGVAYAVRTSARARRARIGA